MAKPETKRPGRKVAAPKRERKNIDKTMLDNFYKLAHKQQHVRLTAAVSSFKILMALKKANTSKFNENINYAVDRLVSGLASARGLARQGFGTLLLEILRTNQISTERLLSIASEKFGHLGNDANMDSLIGYHLLMSVILESGNYKMTKLNEQSLEKIFKVILQLISAKSYMEIPAFQLLIKYHEIFQSYIVQEIPRHAFGSDGRLTTKELLLTLLSNRGEPLKELNNLDRVGFMNLFIVLKDDRLQKQPLHPIFLVASEYVITSRPKLFADFYSSIIQPTFFRANRNELATMGLIYTARMIKDTDNIDAIKTLLTEHIVKTLILSLRNKTPLHKPALQFFSTLEEAFSSEKCSDQKQSTILLKLTTNPGSIAFDEDSKTTCIHNLLAKASPLVLKKYSMRIIEVIHKIPSQSDRIQIQQACARQLAHIIKRTQLNEDKELTTRLIKLLFLTSTFEHETLEQVDEVFFTKNNLCKPKRKFAAETINVFKNSYHLGLEHLMSINDSTQRIELLKKLIILADQIFKSKNTDNKPEQWSRFMKALDHHNKLISKQENPRRFCQITTLYLIYGLLLVEYGLDCTEQTEELEKSYTEILEADPSDGSWADILTDQIIALLSATECKSWVRLLCVSIFGSLLPHISQTSITLLCDALRQKASCEDGDEDGGSVDDDDDESMDDAEMSNDQNERGLNSNKHRNIVNDDAEMDDDEEDSDDDTDENDDDEVSDEDQGEDVDMEVSSDKTKDKEGDDADDEEEEEYLDDEQMLKFDKVIADMFKLNQSQKKKDSHHVDFKLRCLDLVKRAVMKKHSDSETIKTILATVIPLAIWSRRFKETRPIEKKVINFLSKMPGKSNHPEVVTLLQRQRKLPSNKKRTGQRTK